MKKPLLSVSLGLSLCCSIFPGVAHAGYAEGLASFNSGDYKTALREFSVLANHGIANAQSMLGTMYWTGNGVPQDHNEAVKWFRLATGQNDALAQYMLGMSYANGTGVPKDDNEAVKWLRLAAEQGQVSAQGYLGFMYANGRTDLQNDKRAVEWLRQAAEMGSTEAKNKLNSIAATAPALPKNDFSEPQSIALPAQKEDSIAAQIAKIAPLSTSITVEPQKDGFKINGQQYTDPNGIIGLYSVNPLSGDFTYLAKSGNGREMVIKSGRALMKGQPITVARASMEGNSWKVTTLSGKTIQGDSVIPSSTGILVTRANVAYLYSLDDEIKEISIPGGYVVAQFQNGDVGRTRYLLLEKVQDSSDGKDSLLGNFKALGSMLGVSKKEDFALLDIDTGLPLYIDISAESKNTTALSNCYRKSANSIVNYCNTATSYESLYEPKYGLPNYGHYYWRLSWFKLPDNRKVLISQQGGLSRVTVTNLDTGSSTVLFERLLGIAGFSTVQDTSGAIQVTAKLGFMRERISDAVAVMDGAKPQPETIGGPSLF